MTKHDYIITANHNMLLCQTTLTANRFPFKNFFIVLQKTHNFITVQDDDDGLHGQVVSLDALSDCSSGSNRCR
jgi:hypothetical protein